MIATESITSLLAGVATLAPEQAHGAAHAAPAGTGPAWIALIVALPLFGVILSGLGAAIGDRSKLPAWLTVGCLGSAFVVTLAMFLNYDAISGGHGGFVVHLYDWIHVSWAGAGAESGADTVSFIADFGFYIDRLTVLWMLFVTGLATLIALYASEYMSHDVGPGYCRFFAAFNLFVFSMACLVMADNLILLYLGWEGVGLCSYLLIGYFYKKPSAVAAAKKAFIVNRIGDLGLALGIYLTFVHFGTVEYAKLFSNETLLAYTRAVADGDFSSIPTTAQAIPLLLMVGAFGKSAQLPLYVWLPDAMEGPTPVSALIHAATMVTAGVFLIARMYPVFLPSEYALPIVAWVGTLTALLAATIGMAQFDIKRIMAYSTVSQLGYMFAGLGMLTTTGAAFHVLTHAFFKALLFLCCGAVMHGFAGQLDLRKLSGVAWMKGWGIVGITMLVGCMNLSGLPYITSGFYSKDMILAEAFVTPGYAAIGWILVVTAGLTAYYTFRVFFRVFVGPQHFEPGDEHHGDEHDDPAHESAHDHAHDDHAHGFHPHAPGWAINLVLVILASLSIAAIGLAYIDRDQHGWVGSMIHDSSAYFHSPYAEAAHHASVEGVEARAVAGPVGTHAPTGFFGMDAHKAMIVVSGGVAILGVLLAAFFHGPVGIQGLLIGGRRSAASCRMDAVARLFGPIPRWAEHKWYVDEFYHAAIVIPVRVASHLFHLFDKFVIDGIVDGFGRLPRGLAGLVRPSQSGQLQGYAVGMVGGIAILLVVVLVVLAGGGA